MESTHTHWFSLFSGTHLNGRQALYIAGNVTGALFTLAVLRLGVGFGIPATIRGRTARLGLVLVEEQTFWTAVSRQLSIELALKVALTIVGVFKPLAWFQTTGVLLEDLRKCGRFWGRCSGGRGDVH